MAYIDKSGNVCEGQKKQSIIEMIMSFFILIWMFFASLLGIQSSSRNSYQPTSDDYRNVVRGSRDGGFYRGGGGGGGGGGGDGFRRNIGRLPNQSDIPPPPMGGGCCGGGGCG